MCQNLRNALKQSLEENEQLQMFVLQKKIENHYLNFYINKKIELYQSKWKKGTNKNKIENSKIEKDRYKDN